jgi:hypothetical protein
MARSLVLAVLVFLFVGVLVASAQQVNPCTLIHVPRTAVTLFTTTDRSSKTATEDDEIQLRADNEIRIDDCLLIAKGATHEFFLPHMKPIESSDADSMEGDYGTHWNFRVDSMFVFYFEGLGATTEGR